MSKDKIRKYDFAQLLQMKLVEKETPMDYQTCIDFINAFQDVLLKVLIEDCEVHLVNFGKFFVYERSFKVPIRKKNSTKVYDVLVPKFQFSKSFIKKLKENK